MLYRKTRIRIVCICVCDTCQLEFERPVAWATRHTTHYHTIQCQAKAQKTNGKLDKKKRELSLKKYGVENPFANKEVKEKIRTTVFEKYGVENVSQAEVVQNKIQAVIKANYGSENAFQQTLIEKRTKTFLNPLPTVISYHDYKNLHKYFSDALYHELATDAVCV